MAVILLLRHATTAATGLRLGGWTPGVHLDERGQRQAAATASLLDGVDVSAVVSSPLERTMDTAEVVAAAVGCEVVVDRGLGETDYGDWTDRPLEELREEPLWRVIQRTPSQATFPGGESLRASQARIVDAVADLAASHGPGDVVVAVSHADPIKSVVAHHLGMPLDLFQRLVISPASISILVLGPDMPPMVLGVNLRDRLPDIAGFGPAPQHTPPAAGPTSHATTPGAS